MLSLIIPGVDHALIRHSYQNIFLNRYRKKKRRRRKGNDGYGFTLPSSHISLLTLKGSPLSHPIKDRFEQTKREQQIRAARRWCTVSVALWTYVLRFHSISPLRLIIARSRPSFRKSNVSLNFARNFVTSILISPVSMGRLKYTRTYREKYFALSRLFYHFSHVNVSYAVRYWTPLISCNLRSIVEQKIPERFVSSFWTKYWVCPCYFRD